MGWSHHPSQKLVKNVGKEHADHLIAVLKEHYELTEDCGGTKYCRITLDCDYEKREVHMSMPGYVRKAFVRFQHPVPEKTGASTLRKCQASLRRENTIHQRGTWIAKTQQRRQEICSTSHWSLSFLRPGSRWYYAMSTQCNHDGPRKSHPRDPQESQEVHGLRCHSPRRYNYLQKKRYDSGWRQRCILFEQKRSPKPSGRPFFYV